MIPIEAQQKLYIIGNQNNWPSPEMVNYDKIKDYVLVETYDGSNIFTGEFDMSKSPDVTLGYEDCWYFRIYDKLMPDAQNVHGSVSWTYATNSIISAGYKGDLSEEEKAQLVWRYGESPYMRCDNGVFHSRAKHLNGRRSLADEGSDNGMLFCIPCQADSHVRITLDMNKETLEATTDELKVIVPEGDPKPTYSNIGRYLSSGKYIAAADEYRFRIYCPYDNSWYGAADTDSQEINSLSYETLNAVKGSERYFVIKNWPGGTLSLNYTSGRYQLWMTPDYNARIEEDTLYLVGNFCGWDFNQCLTISSSESENGKVFKGTIPAGASSMKFSVSKDWNTKVYGSKGYGRILSDGKLQLMLEGEGPGTNIVIKPMAEDIDFELTANGGFLTFTGVQPEVVYKELPVGDTFTPEGDYLVMYFKNDRIKPHANMSLGEFMEWNPVKLERSDDGLYRANMHLRSGDSFRIAKTFGESEEENEVWAPNIADNRLSFDNAAFVTLATPRKAENAGWWSLRNNGIFDIVFDPGAGRLSVSADITLTGAWLIGTPNGWLTPDESNRMNLEPWKLQTTSKGYYGKFEIPADDANDRCIFRFYTVLNGWDGGASIGSQIIDYPLDYEFRADAENLCLDYVEGKGSWHLAGWNGGTMYIFINRQGGTVTFSRVPLDDIVGPAINLEENSDALWVSNNYGHFDIMAPENDGLYHLGNYGQLKRVFHKRPVHAFDEPEWGGSYAIVPNSMGDLQFNANGVAELNLRLVDGVNTSGGIDFPSVEEAYKYNAYLDLSAMKLYVVDSSRRFIVGDYNNWQMPDIRHSSSFNGAVSVSGYPYVVLTPGAGNRKLRVVSMGDKDLEGNYEINVDMSEGIANNTTADFSNNYLYNDMINISNFKGGKLLIATNMMCALDESACMNISVALNDKSIDYPLKNEGNGIFSAENLNIPGSKDGASFSCYLSYGKSDYKKIIPSGYKMILLDNQSRASLQLKPKPGIGLPTAFSLPQIGTNSAMDFRIDLNTLIASLKFDSSEFNDVLIVDNEYDSYSLTSKSIGSDVIEGVVYNYSNDITIRDTSGKYLAPADYSNVVWFDNHGFHEVKTVETDTPFKWTLDTEYYYNGFLSISFNKSASTLRLHSSIHNDDWFVNSGHGVLNSEGYNIGYEYASEADMDNLSKLQSSGLKEIYPGSKIYEGSVNVEASENPVIALTKGLRNTHALQLLDYNSQQTIDLSRVKYGQSSEYYVFPNNYYFFSSTAPMNIDLGGQPARLDFKLDENTNILTIVKGEYSNVETISGEDDSLKITPTLGGIMISSTEAMQLPIYSLSGIVAKIVDIRAGINKVELPKGVYFIAHRKLMVQ